MNLAGIDAAIAKQRGYVRVAEIALGQARMPRRDISTEIKISASARLCRLFSIGGGGEQW